MALVDHYWHKDTLLDAFTNLYFKWHLHLGNLAFLWHNHPSILPSPVLEPSVYHFWASSLTHSGISTDFYIGSLVCMFHAVWVCASCSVSCFHHLLLYASTLFSQFEVGKESLRKAREKDNFLENNFLRSILFSKHLFMALMLRY